MREAEAGELAAGEEAGVEPEVDVRVPEGQAPDAVAGEVEELVVEGVDEPGEVARGEPEGADGRGAAEEERVDFGGGDVGAAKEVDGGERLPAAARRAGERRGAGHLVDVEPREDVVEDVEREGYQCINSGAAASSRGFRLAGDVESAIPVFPKIRALGSHSRFPAGASHRQMGRAGRTGLGPGFIQFRQFRLHLKGIWFHSKKFCFV